MTEEPFDHFDGPVDEQAAQAPPDEGAVDPTGNAAPLAARQRFAAPNWPVNSAPNIAQTPSYRSFVAGNTTAPPPGLTPTIAIREMREAYDRLFMQYRTPPGQEPATRDLRIPIGRLPKDPDGKTLVEQVDRIADALERLAADVDQRHAHLAEADRQLDKRADDAESLADRAHNATRGIDEVLARSLAENAKRHDAIGEQLDDLLNRERYLIDTLAEERRRADRLAATLDKALDRIDLLESDILRLEKQP